MKRYTAKKKARILTFAASHNDLAAHRKYGVSCGAIRKWREGGDSADVETKTTKKTEGGFKLEVPIPEHIVREAAVRYLQDRLGIKLIQL